ncbi:MAG: bifunctional folylpolyglutamate synthase/dihydrofolate synthase [Bacillota bacterium]
MDFVSYISEFQQFPRLGLERMKYLMELLGNPQDGLRVIHVAGTNGKGSLCAYLDAVLTAAGYRVGKYSSPELERVNERITVSGKEIETGELEALIRDIKPAVDEVCDRLDDAPSRFEISTAAAFLHFARQKCDFAVLETGMGGRLDATNICKKPLVSVIMPVAPDHQVHLGDTVGMIAGEKAGIIKPGVPVVCAPQTQEALKVIERVCREKGSPLHVTDAEGVFSRGTDGFHERIAYKGWMDVRVGLPGWHQAVNAAVALDVVQVLRYHGMPVPDGAVLQGIGGAQHKGRMEIFRQSPLLLFDGAHNTDGACALACSLERYCPGRKMTVAMAVMRDKDIDGMLHALRGVAKRFIALEVPDNPRALEAQALLVYMRATGIESVPGQTMEQVVSLQEDTVVCGSLYLYASFKRCMQKIYE